MIDERINSDQSPPLGEEEIPHETDVDARKFRTQPHRLSNQKKFVYQAEIGD